MFKFCKHQLWECSRTLSDVAMGRRPADTVIRGARLVNVCTHEILDHTDVAIACGRIALVGDAAHCIGPETEVIEAGGQLLAPGFLDGHIHIESSMLTPVEYARAVLPHGTTGIYYDPHEICNVLGLKGVDLMAADAAKTPLKAMLTTRRRSSACSATCTSPARSTVCASFLIRLRRPRRPAAEPVRAAKRIV